MGATYTVHLELIGKLVVDFLFVFNFFLSVLQRKDYRIGTLHYNWPMSVHASQALACPLYR